MRILLLFSRITYDGQLRWKHLLALEHSHRWLEGLVAVWGEEVVYGESYDFQVSGQLVTAWGLQPALVKRYSGTVKIKINLK